MAGKDSLENRLYELDYNGYTPIEKLGFGFCSYVFKVIKGSDVKAVKVPKPESKFFNLIKHGAEALITLNDSANVVDIYFDKYFTHSTKRFPFYFMEFLEGKTVKQRMEEGGVNPLSIDTAVNVTLKTIKALKDAHKKKIYHGDIRPSNVFLLNNGGIKLTDFDISRYILTEGDEKLKQQFEEHLRKYPQIRDLYGDKIDEEKFTATIEWRAPEHKREFFDERGDIFMLVKLFYYMISGQVDLTGVPDPPSTLKHIGKEFAIFDDLVDRGMRANRENRTITLDEIEDMLSQVVYRKSTPLLNNFVDNLNQYLDYGVGKLTKIDFPSTYSESEEREKFQEVDKKCGIMFKNANNIIRESLSLTELIKKQNMSGNEWVDKRVQEIVSRLHNRFTQESEILTGWSESRKVVIGMPEYKLVENLQKYVRLFKNAPEYIKQICREIEPYPFLHKND